MKEKKMFVNDSRFTVIKNKDGKINSIYSDIRIKKNF